ncbi:unnamed protein product [Caenorhabditis brenneri]
MSEPPSLTTIPNQLLAEILNIVDYPSLATLCRVSKPMRFFIKTSKPDIHAIEIFLKVSKEMILCDIVFDDESIVPLEYHHNENGCLVLFEEKSTFLKDTHYFDAFEMDSQLIWQHLKSKLEIFEVFFCPGTDDPTNQRFSDLLKRNLEILPTQKDRNRIKAQKLKIVTTDPKCVLSILPFINAGSLKEVILRIPGVRNEIAREQTIGLNQIRETKQWQQLKTFNAERFLIFDPIESFLHLDKMMITRNVFVSEDLEILKNAIVRSTTFRSYKIHYSQFAYLRHFLMKYEETLLSGISQYMRIFDKILREANLDDDDEEANSYRSPYEKKDDEPKLPGNRMIFLEFDGNEIVQSSAEVFFFRMEFLQDQLLSIKHHGAKKVLLLDLCPVDDAPVDAIIN